MKKIIALAIFFVLFMQNASASYITGTIHIDETGNAIFDIETDTPFNIAGLVHENNKITGKTNQLVSLKTGVWTFELEGAEYDDIYLDIYLPKNLEAIRTINGSDTIIEIDKKIITIADSGKLEFAVSYSLRQTTNYSWLYWLAVIALIIAAFFVYKKISRKKERFQNILPIINEKEQKIIDSLMKTPRRQKELRKELEIPKASFTRYIINLEKKKLIIREGEGKNKLLKLK